MPVVYDRSQPHFLMVSPSAWTATPPLKWFDNYHIVSTIDGELVDDNPKVHNFAASPHGVLAENKVKAMYQNPGLTPYLAAEGLQDFSHLLNRANDYSGHIPTLTNDYGIVRSYENKAWFRRELSNSVQFPDFLIEKLGYFDRGGMYAQLADKLSNTLVVQHPALAGGRGTYIVSSEAEYLDSLNELKMSKYSTEELVVSRFVSGSERTLQCCITANDILVGPAQMQLVRHPQLAIADTGSIQFCGGMISPGIVTDDVYRAMKQSAMIIGAQLNASGYRGIFGVDFLISDAVYVLEVNPRFTGLSPLLANMQTNAPYMLLHILEHAKLPYSVSGDDVHTDTGSFVILYAQSDGSTSLRSGVYDANLNRIAEPSRNLIPENEDHFFIAMRVASDIPFYRGKSLAFIYSKQRLFSESGELLPALELLIQKIRQTITPSVRDSSR